MLPEDSAPMEAELVRRIADGDRDAFAALYDRYAKPLFAFSLRILNSPTDAEDVLQDVFVHIWERAGQYDETQGKPFSWAVAMTRNKSIDRLRSLQRRSRLAEEAAEAGVVESVAAPDGGFGSDESGRIRTAVNTLPAEQRSAIEMAFFRGLTHHQIAEALHEPLGTIKARIRRGMLALRDSLEGTL